MKEKLTNIFNKLKNNSIGENKRVKKNRRKISANLKQSVATLLSIMTAATFVGCGIKEERKEYTKENFKYKNVMLDDTFNGFTYEEIHTYEKQRVINLMENYGMDDYSIVDGKRDYNYEVSDYEKVYTLDESYLRGFYYLTTDKTFDTVVNSLGYTDVNDFMEKNNYKTEDEWVYDDINNISYMMSLRTSKTR